MYSADAGKMHRFFASLRMTTAAEMTASYEIESARLKAVPFPVLLNADG